MLYFVKEEEVTREKAQEYVEKLWGPGKLAEREQEAREYFAEECDDCCSWADGFAIKY